MHLFAPHLKCIRHILPDEEFYLCSDPRHCVRLAKNVLALLAKLALEGVERGRNLLNARGLGVHGFSDDGRF